ncbi:MAG: hypothetical protein QT05_C0005G0009 [archaeon GW2011_AR13]|nr:MAG: hypothetical protein QT05_C0005G0009 [archaeon GW2011_AR13]HIG94484.1 HAD hydrolase-like protein [Nanoarchaeota archaeon]HIH62994.1 HAD hydrolase-like protein [Nanoarchaeota archaeon]HIJ10259.1 HAD hydrolase-like protein [Nanoarchaeota archaeon]
MNTKVVALDIYGTLLPTKGNNIPRKGLESFLNNCKSEELILCTCSDGKIQEVKNDLLEAGIDLKCFNKYFEMPRQSADFIKQPKDPTIILNYYNLSPEELTVIGDREERDIAYARELGCNTILVPEYKIPEDKDNFDLSKLEIK